MECTILGDMGIAQIGVFSIGIAMILFALFLGIGCIRGIQEERRLAGEASALQEK